jgi:hypothetical protein
MSDNPFSTSNNETKRDDLLFPATGIGEGLMFAMTDSIIETE